MSIRSTSLVALATVFSLCSLSACADGPVKPERERAIPTQRANAGSSGVTALGGELSIISGVDVDLDGRDDNVTFAPDGDLSAIAPAYIVPVKNEYWVDPIAGTSWIGPTSSGSTGTAGSWTFKVTFTLPSAFSAPLLEISTAMDNCGTVELNGHLVGEYAAPCTDYAHYMSVTTWQLSDPAAFVKGTNTLTFDLENANDCGGCTGNPAGLDFRAVVSYTQGVGSEHACETVSDNLAVANKWVRDNLGGSTACNLLAALRLPKYFDISPEMASDEAVLGYIYRHPAVVSGLLETVDYGNGMKDFLDSDNAKLLPDDRNVLSDLESANDLASALDDLAKVLGATDPVVSAEVAALNVVYTFADMLTRAALAGDRPERLQIIWGYFDFRDGSSSDDAWTQTEGLYGSDLGFLKISDPGAVHAWLENAYTSTRLVGCLQNQHVVACSAANARRLKIGEALATLMNEGK